jgi:hypothetical protein
MFEWDPKKDAANIRKHGISFAQAAHVFNDPLAVTRLDRVEGSELRWHTIGEFEGTLLLLVVHTLEGEQPIELIRIISARRATPRERRRYEEENG